MQPHTAAILLCFTVPTMAADRVEVGTSRQLFVDDHIVDSMDRVVRVVQQPKRIGPKPILTKDRPWEGDVLQMPCVLWDADQQIFHMYYWSAPDEGIYTCYARSKDGIRWEKPILNLHVGPDGSKENNIVLRGNGKVARTRYVVFNPDRSDRQRRFLALYIDNVPGLTEFAASSPDGLHWTTEKKIGDLRHVTGGSETTNPPFFLIEQQWARDPNDGHRYRAIWRTESQDLKNWTGGRHVVKRLPDDDPNLEFYHACSHFQGSHTYHGLHFGYLYLFHTEPQRGVRTDGVRLAGTVDTSLMVSRDTLNWHRVDRKRRFLPLGDEGSWDGRMVYCAPETIVGDRLFFYYSGWSKEHGADNNTASIGLATLPMDRFAAIQPEQRRGSLTTKPFVVKGGELRINADAPNGELRVDVLQENGQPIPGYTAEFCRPIRDDESSREVTWRGRSFEGLRGRCIRLKFRLLRAKLFSFEVQ